ncbi:MAG: hypothetical protein HFI66_05225 [Lachnospiraceae bacterium]|jgi:hypothetical protein|nr:hypothetical protein [Lachnospiraceae bacterium]
MKKLFPFCLALVLLLAACGTKKEKPLYDQGLELVSLMNEMTQSDSYFEMFSTSPAIKEQMAGIAEAAQAGLYQKPKTVYRITADMGGLMKFWESSSGADMNLDGMSPELTAYIQARLFNSCASILNSSAGMEAIAASSIYMCSKSFVCREAGESTAYLYIYEDARPVLITFIVGEDNAVSASGSYILGETDIESLSGLFGLSGFQIDELNLEYLE